MAVTYDYNDLAGGYFSGFSQSFDVSRIIPLSIRLQM